MKEQLILIAEQPRRLEQAASWFHQKWGIPLEAYTESMRQSLTDGAAVPQWLIAVQGERIVGGLGVIQNDFHDRPDLAPNVCAVYVDPAWRRQGLARLLLDHVCRELAKKGIHDAYLVTSHTDFYERCGWSFLTMVEEDGGELTRMYHKHT